MRYAVYYAPEDEPLRTLAGRWLSRDSTRPPVDVDPQRWRAWTEAPRRYGLHATLKAPFRLRAGSDETALFDAVAALAATLAPVTLPALALSRIGRFVALTPAAPSTESGRLAGRCVVELDAFRAAPGRYQPTRRRRAPLDTREEELLARWGYPYVLDRYRFHITLTGPLADADADVAYRLLQDYLAPALARPARIDALSVFVEPQPDAPFEPRARFALAAC